MQRMGQCLKLKPDTIAEYKRLHAAVWPGVLARIAACNIRNYTIFLKEPENILFAYWEYHGDDFAADTAAMSEDQVTRDWWKICSPLQQPFETRQPGEWWAMMEPVFHTD
ncbi:MAG TPA: L-rhamnose mutarotase [Bradyrhizobium sp.]